MMPREKYYLTTETIDFNPNFQTNDDLIIQEFEKGVHDFDSLTLLSIKDHNDRQIKIRIDWCNYSTERNVSLIIIPETNKLFFGTRFSWGIIDLVSIKIDRQESCLCCWGFERFSDTVVLTTEHSAVSLSLHGKTIDEVFIDPPFERDIFEDRIEFVCPVFGHQVLQLKSQIF